MIRFERCFNPRLINKGLIEQLPKTSYDSEAFYRFMEFAVQTPTQMLFLILNDDEIIGFTWAEVNILEKTLFVNILSLKRDYWHKKIGIETAVDFYRELVEKFELKKVYWITDRPALFKLLGFEESEQILMEYIA